MPQNFILCVRWNSESKTNEASYKTQCCRLNVLKISISHQSVTRTLVCSHLSYKPEEEIAVFMTTESILKPREVSGELAFLTAEHACRELVLKSLMTVVCL